MAIKKTEKPKVLKIANTEIVFGKVYTIDHKFDGSAPDGMRELGATKFPLVGVEASEKVYFDENRNVFDTGFYVESLCNKSLLERDNPEEMVRLYNEFIKEPYEKRMTANCSESNFQFWDKFNYSVRVNKSYNTNDPLEMFELFHALKQGVVCNKGEKDSKLQKAQYNISNFEAIKSKEDTKFDNKMKAINTFNLLLDSDEDKLFTILEYLQAVNPRGTDKSVLKRTYLRQLDDTKQGTDLVARFLEASEKYNEPKGQLEMQYFAVCQKLYLKGKITKKLGSFYDESGNLLANSLKDIARKCSLDSEKEFKEKIEESYQKHFPD
jgi:hypothetical protein